MEYAALRVFMTLVTLVITCVAVVVAIGLWRSFVHDPAFLVVYVGGAVTVASGLACIWIIMVNAWRG